MSMYITIFKRPVGKKDVQIGNPTEVRVGDVIGFNTSRGYHVRVVRQIFPRAKKVKTEPAMYGKAVLHRGEIVFFDAFLEILRPNNSQQSASEQPVPEPPTEQPKAAESPAAKPAAEEFVPPWLYPDSD